jgi:hypothetical protein
LLCADAGTAVKRAAAKAQMTVAVRKNGKTIVLYFPDNFSGLVEQS